MSELRESIHKNDFVMNKGNKKLYFVIKIDLHAVWARVEDDSKGDDADLERIPKHMINKFFIKVNPDVMKVLYGNKDGTMSTDHIPDLPPSEG